MRAARAADRRRLEHSVCLLCRRVARTHPSSSYSETHHAAPFTSPSSRHAAYHSSARRLAPPDNDASPSDPASRPKRTGSMADAVRAARAAVAAERPQEEREPKLSEAEQKERQALSRAFKMPPAAPRLDDPKQAAPRRNQPVERNASVNQEARPRADVWRPTLQKKPARETERPTSNSVFRRITPGSAANGEATRQRQYTPRPLERPQKGEDKSADRRSSTFRALSQTDEEILAKPDPVLRGSIVTPTIHEDDAAAARAQRRANSEAEPLPMLDRQTSPREDNRPARRHKDDDELDNEDDKPRRAKAPVRKRFDNEDEDEDDSAPSRRRGGKSKPDRDSRRSQKLEELEEDDEDIYDEDEYREKRRKQRKARKAERDAAAAAARDPDAVKPTIELPAFTSVQALATILKVRPEEFVTKLNELGFEDVAMDHVLNFENASLVAMEYGHEPAADRSDEGDIKPRPLPADPSVMPPRPPVVTIMGHVDHGKTTLLDYLRQSSVAASEFGGITQHIGAFSVPIASAGGRLVTFLDTPGHAAFLSMRQRGATVTDIVVLVVAADDSVKPQTIEAIKHARASGVQLLVAITKCDRDGADPARVKADLLQHDVEVEDMGGSIQAIEVSGKTGAGVPELEEALIAQADVLDLRADTEGAPEGWVLEATTRRSGRAATVLMRRGTLRAGDVIVAGTTWARARTLVNEAGARVAAATPGTPVEVDGWREQPTAGDEVLGADSESHAADVVDLRIARRQRQQASSDMETLNATRRADSERRAVLKEADEAARQRMIDAAQAGAFVRGRALREAGRAARTDAARAFDEANTAANGGASGPEGMRTLYLVVKADVSGSAEAAVEAIGSLPTANQPVRATVLRAAAGPISENDIALASAAPAGDCLLVNFGQDLAPSTSSAAERAGVPVLDARVIYALADGVRLALEERLPPVVTKRVLGEAEAAAAFEVRTGKGTSARVAGCRVKNGVLQHNKLVRVFRGGVGGEVVFEGRMAGLRVVKRDVQEVRKGMECGVSFEGWDLFEEGDTLQCFEEEHERRRLPAG